jgi:hypothetical protein
MKYLYKSTAILLLLLPMSTMSIAAEPKKSDDPLKEPSGSQGMGSGHQGMGMGMGMECCQTEEQKTEHMRAMQEHMLQMHDLSNQILSEKDPAKKEELKNKQLELMKTFHGQMKQHRQQRMQEHKK